MFSIVIVITIAREFMFLPLFVCWLVCLFVNRISQLPVIFIKCLEGVSLGIKNRLDSWDDLDLEPRILFITFNIGELDSGHDTQTTIAITRGQHSPSTLWPA